MARGVEHGGVDALRQHEQLLGGHSRGGERLAVELGRDPDLGNTGGGEPCWCIGLGGIVQLLLQNGRLHGFDLRGGWMR